MSKQFSLILGLIFVTTVLFWLFVLATYEIFWEVNTNFLRSKVIEVDPIFKEEKLTSLGEKLLITPEEYHEEELPELPKKDLREVYLRSVESFGPLHIGGAAPSNIELRPNEIPSDAELYVLFNRMGFGSCNNEYCAPLEGKVIECMGGWLSGGDGNESSFEVGLSNTLVKQGKASMVVVSDKNEKIIGIFPYHTEVDILPILAQFPEYEEALGKCKDKFVKPLLGL